MPKLKKNYVSVSQASKGTSRVVKKGKPKPVKF